MHRLFISICVIFLFFSCSQDLSVSQINAGNIQVNFQTSFNDSVIQSVIKPYMDSIEHNMSTTVAVAATALKKDKPDSKLTNLIANILLDTGTEYCKSHNSKIRQSKNWGFTKKFQ